MKKDDWVPSPDEFSGKWVVFAPVTRYEPKEVCGVPEAAPLVKITAKQIHILQPWPWSFGSRVSRVGRLPKDRHQFAVFDSEEEARDAIPPTDSASADYDAARALARDAETAARRQYFAALQSAWNSVVEKSNGGQDD